jgi:ankyrin repeat protein
LIDRGADVNAKDETEQSAYLIATSEGYLDLLNLTLQHGADVDSKDSFAGTGLIRAADRGHADIAGTLIQAGMEIDHVNNLGWTAPHQAIILGDGSGRYVTTVQVLVAAGADVRLPWRRDQVCHATTPRRGRGRRRHRGWRSPWRGGAELEARDERERTALLGAVTKDRLAAARVLVPSARIQMPSMIATTPHGWSPASPAGRHG